MQTITEGDIVNVFWTIISKGTSFSIEVHFVYLRKYPQSWAKMFALNREKRSPFCTCSRVYENQYKNKKIFGMLGLFC